MFKPFTGLGLVRRRGEVPSSVDNYRTSSDPSKRRRWKPPAQGWADFSPCGAYRYTLGREYSIEHRLEGVESRPGYIVWLMLNPSEAHESHDDPTVHRCFVRSRSMLLGYRDNRSEIRVGWDSAVVLNLFALRATNPEVMLAAEDPVGPMNNPVLREVCSGADFLMIAWGCDGRHRDRDVEVLANLRTQWRVEGGTPRNIYALGLNDAFGDRPSPCHPLYLGYDKRAIPLGVQFDVEHRIIGIERGPV